MPLTAWQICRAKDIGPLGKSCLHSGGRWNSPGRDMVYLSEHPALAALECRAHLDLPYDEMEHDHRLLRLSLPEDSLEDLADLPADPTAIGDAWLTEARSAVLRVPSILVQEGRNLLLNPAHPAARDARLLSATEFRFDRRLWASG
jgi:RES domain-containing protein